MKVITTKYVGPTNTRGSKIIARAEGVASITVPYSYEGDTDNAHRRAAEKLAAKYNWGPVFKAGTLPDGATEVWAFRSVCRR
jgi:hypothetical protein